MSALLVLTVEAFLERADRPSLAEELASAYRQHLGGGDADVSDGEFQSWMHSLPALASLLRSACTSIGGHILLEYQVPIGLQRADCVLLADDEGGQTHVVVFELKQWSREAVSVTRRDGVDWVQVDAGARKYSVAHPCQQVSQYRYALEHALDLERQTATFHTVVLLHNYVPTKPDPLFAGQFGSLASQASVLTRHSAASDLSGVLEKCRGPSALLPRFERPRLRYSDTFILNLTRNLNASLLFPGTSEQNRTLQKLLAHMDGRRQEKVCLVVRGIVGTGKTVLALKMVHYLLQQGRNPAYDVKSKAIGECLKAVGFPFGSNSTTDCLIVDEAHRLSTRDALQRLNQRKFVVFFIDDRQWICPDETTRSDDLVQAAHERGFHVIEERLSTQLRCRGAGAYIDWVQGVLFESKTEPPPADTRFRVAVAEDPAAMERALRQLADRSLQPSTRMVAGYCWPWLTKNTLNASPDIQINGWRARWNAFQKYKAWNERPGFHEEVGAVYTVQGFEHGYVGVLLGPDLQWSSQGVVVQPDGCVDARVKNSRDDDIVQQAIRNIYYVLLTRARYGVILYALDPALQAWLMKYLPRVSPETIASWPVPARQAPR